jgi:hypothetical protein
MVKLLLIHNTSTMVRPPAIALASMTGGHPYAGLPLSALPIQGQGHARYCPLLPLPAPALIITVGRR